MKISNKIIICLGMVLIFPLLFIEKVFAGSMPDEYISIINSSGDTEYLYDENPESSDKTATYDSTNYTLTLNDYNGGIIECNVWEDLTIVLNGNNVITSDFYYDGIMSYTGLTFEGKGSLLIKNAGTGISVYSGDLNIDGASITMKNILYTGIFEMSGKVIIDGKLSMDSSDSEILDEFGYFDEYYSAITARDNIEINGDLIIKHASSGIDSNGSVIVSKGNSTIQAISLGVHAAKSFTMNGGKLDINLEGTPLYPIPIYGIDTGIANITNGYLHVKVEDGSVAIASFGEYEVDPSITIGNNLIIDPSNYAVIEKEIDPYTVKTIGLDSSNIATEFTLYAKETVTFNTNGGSSINNGEVMFASKITKPTDPTKKGYTFAGWYEDGTFVKEFDFDTEITENITLYAKWVAVKYNITLNINDEKMGSAEVNLNSAEEGTEISLTSKANTGYRFSKWESTDVDASTGVFKMPDHNVTIKAIFELNTYKITFDANGGSGSMDGIEIDPLTAELPKCQLTPPKGMKFSGWSLSTDGSILTSLKDITRDTTFYAIWEKVYEYKFIDGDNQKLVLDDINGYTFTIDGDYSLFDSLKVGDLELVKDEDYTIAEGSTIITFTKNGINKLKKLIKGEYEIQIKYTNSKTVTGKVFLSGNELNPETNDNIYLYIIIGIVSLFGLFSSLIAIKKKIY